MSESTEDTPRNDTSAHNADSDYESAEDTDYSPGSTAKEKNGSASHKKDHKKDQNKGHKKDDKKEDPSITDAFSEAAQEVLAKRLRWVGLLRKAIKRLGEERSVPAVIADDASTLFRMVQAWRKGTYPTFPWRSVGMLTLAVFYFLIFRGSKGKSLAGMGIVDDTAIIAFVVRTTHKELNRFRTWEQKHSTSKSKDA